MRQIISYLRVISDRLIVLLAVIIALCQCNSPNNKKTDEEERKKKYFNTLWEVRDVDSLFIILDSFIEQNDALSQLLIYKQIGIRQRDNARFSDAIKSHQKGLNIAIELNDTVEIVQAMNNLGTNFRRIGAHNEASQYHYQALHMAEAWSGLYSKLGVKNRIIALNGIGNISLMLGYYDDAESNFREALKHEVNLKSPIGQAINYANLGAVFEIRKQIDSAYIYYQKSLEQNKIANSDMGIGLCLIHIGELYEKEENYELATAEYVKAYELMDKISDKWHWLQACISVARIHLKRNNNTEFKYYIELAEKSAEEIKSPEHLAAVYLLKHEFDIKQGNFNHALNNYKLHKVMKDSVQGQQMANRYMEIRLGHEQNKNLLRIQQIEATGKMEQQKKQFVIYISWIIIFVSLVITASLYYAYKQRTRSNKLLKNLELTRSSFFTNITHEFRTPLTVIKGLNRQMQLKKNLSENEQTALRAAIERQSNNLINLVNQLLDISKLKQGSDNSEWSKGNIVSYVQISTEAFRLYAKQNGIELIFFTSITSTEMDFIPSYIDKIISNLLSNAIKNTDAGGKINLTINRGKRPDTINIKISDTGRGISNESIKYIFDLFYQSPEGKRMIGTGIGLAFTKMMVEKMGGEIAVESQLGKGTLFTIMLPLKNKKISNIKPLVVEDHLISYVPNIKYHDLENEYLPNILEENIETSDQKPLILIVEDNRDITLYFKMLLTKKYRVIIAWNGVEGLRAAEDNIPDLVITDLMMPEKDGYQLASEMKESKLLNHVPVIMVTAKNSDEDFMKALHCGVETYIRKPFKKEELLLRIENILENRRIVKEKYMSIITRSEDKTGFIHDENLKFLQSITKIIYSEIMNPEINSGFLADKMELSISQLNRKINGITGYSTISYILKLKLIKAKKMLLDNNISIKEVSDSCGFDDSSHFLHAFKKEYGVSPTYYKKAILNNK